MLLALDQLVYQFVHGDDIVISTKRTALALHTTKVVLPCILIS